MGTFINVYQHNTTNQQTHPNHTCQMISNDISGHTGELYIIHWSCWYQEIPDLPINLFSEFRCSARKQSSQIEIKILHLLYSNKLLAITRTIADSYMTELITGQYFSTFTFSTKTKSFAYHVVFSLDSWPGDKPGAFPRASIVSFVLSSSRLYSSYWLLKVPIVYWHWISIWKNSSHNNSITSMSGSVPSG